MGKSLHARGLQSKGAPEAYEGSWSPRTAGRWGWSKVMPTPCVSVVSERTAEKIRGPSSSECQQSPAAGNRQGRGMAKVLVQKDHLRSGTAAGVGSRSQGRTCSAECLLLPPSSLPGAGPGSHLSAPLHRHLGHICLLPPHFNACWLQIQEVELLCPQTPSQRGSKMGGQV